MTIPKKEDHNMATTPAPRSRAQRYANGWIDAELHAAVKKALEDDAKKSGAKAKAMRDVIEWGFARYLAEVDPKAAKRLGIV